MDPSSLLWLELVSLCVGLPLCRLGCLIRPRTIRPLRPTLPENLVLPLKSTIRLPTTGAVFLPSSRAIVVGK